MAYSTENALIVAKQQINTYVVGVSEGVNVPMGVLRRLVCAIREFQEPKKEVESKLEKLLKAYGSALIEHEQAGLEHCGKVWPRLLALRERLDETTKKMVKA